MKNSKADKNTAPDQTGYAADSPRRSQEHDELARWPFAARIADTLARRSTPDSLVVGVSGKWGEGKTTVLNFIRQRLTEYDHVVTVDFNPWLYRGREQLLINFFHQLASALQKKLKKFKAIGDGLRQIGGILGGFSIGVGVAKFSPGEPVKRIGETLSDVDVDDLRKRLEEHLTKEQKRIVVLMDDIDRLDREETHAIFKLLKVAADFAWTSYVVSFDAEMVAAVLGDQYGGTPEAGASFLEKIIQVPLQLPKAPRMMLRQFTLEGISRVLDENKIQLSDEEKHRFDYAFDYQVLDRIDTPRSAKRYVNAVEFAIPLLLGEVNIVDVLLMEALRSFYPKLYRIIREHREIVLPRVGVAYLNRNSSWKEQAQEALEPGFEGLAKDHADNAKRLIRELFPSLGKVYGSMNAWDNDNELARGKRVASPMYFDRYFSHGIPVGDIADSELMSLCQTAAEEPAQAVTHLHTLMAGREREILEKLGHLVPQLAPDAARGLLQVVTTIGPHLDEPSVGTWFGKSPFEKAVGLALDVLAHLQPPFRMEAARILMKEADLSFAVSCVKERQSNEQIFEEEEEAFSKPEMDELLRILASRIPTEAEVAPLFLRFPSHIGALLYLWDRYDGLEAVKRHMAHALDANDEKALELLRVCGWQSFDLTLVRRTRGAIHKEAYQWLSRVLNMDQLVASLQRKFPELAPSSSMPVGTTVDEALVNDLLCWHAAAHDEHARVAADKASAPDHVPAPGGDHAPDDDRAPDTDPTPDLAPDTKS